MLGRHSSPSLPAVDRSRRPLRSALVVLALAACGDATGARPPVPAGALSVALSGALAGQYDAEGAQPVPATGAPATFASAIASPTFAGRYLVSGFRARDGDRQDVLNLDLSGVSAPGSYPAAGDLVLGGAGGSALPEQVFRLTAVTVRVTALSAARIAGEFSGEAVGGAFPNSFPVPPADTVRLAAGTFDVPIVRP